MQMIWPTPQRAAEDQEPGCAAQVCQGRGRKKVGGTCPKPPPPHYGKPMKEKTGILVSSWDTQSEERPVGPSPLQTANAPGF